MMLVISNNTRSVLNNLSRLEHLGSMQTFLIWAFLFRDNSVM